MKINNILKHIEGTGIACYISILLIIGLPGCGASGSSKSEEDSLDSLPMATDIELQPKEEKNPLNVLKKTYPDFFSNCELKGDSILIGTETLVFDDRKDKDFIELLDDADIEDMFAMRYSDSIPPNYLMDAGRSRCEKLFKLMYGKNASEVRKHLIRVDWFGESVWFNSRNGAADSLRAVAADLQKRSDLKKYTKSSGTFYWREVRGAKRLSAHSYGIAIDVGVENSNYWRWDHSQAGELDRIKYQNRIPIDLVDIFERHGFIWGGRWYHYDTMHFEFRPEILEWSRNSGIPR